jgi:hypothetical protein
MALEHQARLTFLHVNNADFLVSAGPTLASLAKVKKQIHSLSEFTMTVLCDRAERRGVKNVDYIVRDGQILTQIRAILLELNPDFLVLGKPVETKGTPSAFKTADYDVFIDEIKSSLKITVVPVDIELN